jgi:hypothetical protein
MRIVGMHKGKNKCMQNFSGVTSKGGGHVGNLSLNRRITSDRGFDNANKNTF